MSEAVMNPRADWTRKVRRGYPKAHPINGDGPYAVLAHCRRLSVELFETFELAQFRKGFIDRLGCGGICCNDHEVVDLRDGENMRPDCDREEFRQVRRFWMGV